MCWNSGESRRGDGGGRRRNGSSVGCCDGRALERAASDQLHHGRGHLLSDSRGQCGDGDSWGCAGSKDGRCHEGELRGSFLISISSLLTSLLRIAGGGGLGDGDGLGLDSGRGIQSSRCCLGADRDGLSDSLGDSLCLLVASIATILASISGQLSQNVSQYITFCWLVVVVIRVGLDKRQQPQRRKGDDVDSHLDLELVFRVGFGINP